ncbi:antibiotic biosynthesis monooxygenase [Thioalkalivibrio sp. HL-Eb18]|jgi:heme-degrading monooxygenase HmoA|uniref:antibiotic biosynthesis monooxygenase family protein n=1 Tax=Thioalkalivibrio sp. HL-Eb18 TaxID=1266913 RepID=UPI00036B7EFD|nr:antibiotic biosynthesis monooxygenase family protein [Thioalkalivibrio sp. HL-Eb18]
MIFVFEIRLRPGCSAEQYADAWVRASRIIQQAPGARGTRLHRKIGDPHVLLAIAYWESKDQRDAMEADQPENVRRIIAEQAACVDVRVIGEFADPEWRVDPPGTDDTTHR